MSEDNASPRQPVDLRSGDLSVSVAAKMIRTERIDRYENYGPRGRDCENEAGEGTKEKQEPSPNSRHQNVNRKAKLMTLAVEDPLK